MSFNVFLLFIVALMLQNSMPKRLIRAPGDLKTTSNHASHLQRQPQECMFLSGLLVFKWVLAKLSSGAAVDSIQKASQYKDHTGEQKQPCPPPLPFSPLNYIIISQLIWFKKPEAHNLLAICKKIYSNYRAWAAWSREKPPLTADIKRTSYSLLFLKLPWNSALKRNITCTPHAPGNNA